MLTNITNKISPIVKRHIVIKNEHVTSCSNCLFFIKPTFRYPEPEIQANLYGRCKQFGEKDIITGEVENLHALTCRKDRTLCGFEAKHFLYNFEQK